MFQPLMADIDRNTASPFYTKNGPDRKQEVLAMSETGAMTTLIFASFVCSPILSPLLSLLNLPPDCLLRVLLELVVLFLMNIAKLGDNVHSLTYYLLLLFQLFDWLGLPQRFAWMALLLILIIGICQYITLRNFLLHALPLTMKQHHRRFYLWMKVLCSTYMLISVSSLFTTFWDYYPHVEPWYQFDHFHVSRLFFAFASMVGSKITNISSITTNDDNVDDNNDSHNNKQQQQRTELYSDPDRDRNPPCLVIFMYLIFPIMVLRAFVFFYHERTSSFGCWGWDLHILCATYILHAILLYPSIIQVRSDASILIETLGNRRYVYHNATHAVPKSADTDVPEKKLVDFSNIPKDNVHRKVKVLVYLAKDDHTLQLTPIRPERFMEAVNLAGRQFGESTPLGNGSHSDGAEGWPEKRSESVV